MEPTLPGKKASGPGRAIVLELLGLTQSKNPPPGLRPSYRNPRPFGSNGMHFHTFDPSGDDERRAVGRSARAFSKIVFFTGWGKGVRTSTRRSPPTRLRPFVFVAPADRQPRKDFGRAARIRRSGEWGCSPFFSFSPQGPFPCNGEFFKERWPDGTPTPHLGAPASQLVGPGYGDGVCGVPSP